MIKVTDEYCTKILMVLTIFDVWDKKKEIRFNKLHQELNKYDNAKMSKPTLIEHLKHLVENEIIQRDEKGKQKVSYRLNWKKFKQLQKDMKISQTTLNQIRNEKTFKIKSLDQQIGFTTTMLTIGELLYLKQMILNILEPENKLQNDFSSTIIRSLFNIYATWLYDSCKESKENSQKVLHSIDKITKELTEAFFEKNPEAIQRKPEDTI